MRAHATLALSLTLFASIALGAAGCAERRVAQLPPPYASVTPLVPVPEAATASSVGAAAAEAAPPSWIDSVRLERWAEATTRLDALPEEMKERPDVRYVRARAAVGVGDGAKALALLDGLETRLPLLTQDIIKWRAEAQLLAGSYGEAAAYFSRSQKARDLTRAAEAFEKAGDAASARAAADRAVAAAANKGAKGKEEVAARMARARLHQAKGEDALAEPDLRWVATHAPTSAEGRAATDALEKLKKPLTPKERLQAIDGLVDPGNPEAGPLIEKMARESAAAQGGPKGEVLHSQAMALYRARSFAEAARVFKEAAGTHGAHEAEDLFYEARSLARVERDAEAIKAYRELSSRHARSAFAEKASFNAARLELQNGRFKEAARSYSQYLAQNKKGEHQAEAQYERALALLSANAPEARKALGDLARRAPADKAGKLRELEAVAASRSGDQAGAIAIWTDIAKNEPFTWAALASRARLAQAGAAVPALLDPPVGGPGRGPLELKLPAAPALLFGVGLDGDAEAHLLEGEHEATMAYPGREGEALCGMYGLLSRAKRRYKVGINAVSGALLNRAPSPSERWGWECLYPRPFATGVRSVEEEHQLPRDLVYAVMRQESGFDPGVVSPASAVGLMQLMPATAKQVASELKLSFSPEQLTRPDLNLRLGAYYIAKLLRMFGGHPVLAAAAYNAGPKAVSHWLEAGDQDLDVWVAKIPFEETRTYAAKVAQNMARYQFLWSGGEESVKGVDLAIPKGLKAPADAY